MLPQQIEIDILDRAKKRIFGAIRSRSSHLRSADNKDPLAIAEQRAYLAAMDAAGQAIHNMIQEKKQELNEESDRNADHHKNKDDRQTEMFQQEEGAHNG